MKKIEILEADLKKASNKPVEVAVAEPDEATLLKIKQKAESEARKSAEKEFNKKKKEILEKADKELAEALNKQKEKLSSEIEKFKKQKEIAEKSKKEAEDRAEEFRKKAAIGTNSVTIKAGVILEDLMSCGKKLVECIGELRQSDSESADKYSKAIKERLISIANQLTQ